MLLKYQRNALIWAFLIFCLCAMPSSGFSKFSISNIVGIDKFAHAFIYFVFYILMWFGLRKKNKINKESSLNKGWFWCAIICFIFGVIIEILQGAFFNRGMELLDVVANSFGIILGVFTTSFFSKKMSSI